MNIWHTNFNEKSEEQFQILKLLDIIYDVCAQLFKIITSILIRLVKRYIQFKQKIQDDHFVVWGDR